MSWEITKRRDPHHKLFQGHFGAKQGAPNRPFWATKCLVYCVFSLPLTISELQTHPSLHSPVWVGRNHSENSRRLWLFPGSVRGFFAQENSGKVPVKLLENSARHSRNATNSRISGTGKGKPAGNLGCPHLLCGVFVKIDSSSLLEFFWNHTDQTHPNL